jgi:hypothetical protein
VGKLAKEASGESAATSLSTAETQLLIVGSKIVSRTMVIAILQLDKTPLHYAATFLGHLLPYSDKSRFMGSKCRIQLCEQLSYHVICQPILVTPQLVHLRDSFLDSLIDIISNLAFGFVSKVVVEQVCWYVRK